VRIAADDHDRDVRFLLSRLQVAPQATVIHVGAHRGEEVQAYLDAGFARIILVEANPVACQKLATTFVHDQRVQSFHCALTDHEGTVDLYLHTSRLGSVEPASLLRLKRFKEIVPTLQTPATIRVPCQSLDSFCASHGIDPQTVALLNVDVQGAELLVLAGGRSALASIGAVIAEVSLVELYEGSASEDEIAALLGSYGFRRVEGIYHTLYDEQSTFPAWGECLFAKAPPVTTPVSSR
jgi:FkbM family methyltransferase